MTSVMMALGDYRFSLTTAAYKEFKRSSEYKWVEQSRIGRTPSLQFIGMGKDKIELGGTIYAHFKGGLGQIEMMRNEASKGIPLMLVDGTGLVWGKWCIERVDEEQVLFRQGGIPYKQKFVLQIAAYGDDK